MITCVGYLCSVSVFGICKDISEKPDDYILPAGSVSILRLNPLTDFRATLFHHIMAPVTNIPAGASPTIAQVNFVAMSQSPGPRQGIPMPFMRPKCR
jgi:hypothetical protein